MSTKIKLLHAITHLPIGGAQDNTLYTVELLDKDKYDISVVSSFNSHFLIFQMSLRFKIMGSSKEKCC